MTDEVIPTRSRLSRDERRGAAFVVVVIVTLTALLFAIGSDGKGNGQVLLPSPSTIVKDGVSYQERQVGAEGARRDPLDPNSVLIYAYEANDPQDPLCSTLMPSARVVGETTTTITVATFAYEYAPPAGRPKEYFCSFSSFEDGSLPGGHKIHLHAPLGDRELISARDGRGIGLLPNSPPAAPHYLPAGFKAEGAYAPDSVDFMATRSYLRGGDGLDVSVESDSAYVSDGKNIGSADVGGTPAAITQYDYQRCVAWVGDPGIRHEVCSVPPKKNYLSVAELLKVARSIPR